MEQSRNDMIRQLNHNAGLCLHNEDHAGALEYFNRAMALLPEDGLYGRAVLINNLGHTYVNLHNYDAALSSFQSSADLYRRMGEPIGMAEQLGNIGSVYRDLEKWGPSLEAYFQALAIFQEHHHEKGIADQYSNIAYSYFRTGNTARAFLHFEEARKLYYHLGDTEKAGLCEINLQNIRACFEDDIDGHERS